jgi:hypothetical protein
VASLHHTIEECHDTASDRALDIARMAVHTEAILGVPLIEVRE